MSASIGPGDHAQNGHYICIRDYAPYSELFFAVDPCSTSRNSSAKTLLSGQNKAFRQVRD